MAEIINEFKLENVESRLSLLPHYYITKFNTDVIINSGGRSQAKQEQIYKDKFGAKWKKNMPKHSAHVFKPGEEAHAIDFYVRDMFITKVHAELLSIATQYGIKGIGIDIFHNYIHVDTKDRNRKDILLWAYDSSGVITYLNS